MRDRCLRCLRPAVACFCRQIRKIETRSKIVILQHPLEYRKPIGTARMVQLSLPNSRVLVGVDFSGHSEIAELLADPLHRCCVLYPGRRAVELGAFRESLGGEQGGGVAPVPVVFVLDGTWGCARKLMSSNAWLSELPQVCFTPQGPSEYAIRKQPQPHCVSTLEAVVEVLAQLEPQVDASGLTDVFRGMVAHQLRSFEGRRS